MKLLEGCRNGVFAVVGERRPENPTAENRVRASFIRFLALGGDERAPVAELIQLKGAFIEGHLTLTGCSIPFVLSFLECSFDKEVSAQLASLTGLGFSSCRLPGLHADSITTSGDVLLRQGLHATGPIYLTGARIGGDVDCTGSHFASGERVALSLNKTLIGGDAILNRGFHAEGEVTLSGARIRGSLFCNDALFNNPEGVAVWANGLVVGGDVAFNSGFRANGEVRLLRAEIGGDLNCREGRFLAPTKRAFNVQGLRLKGSLIWQRVVEVQGTVDLTAASAASLVDDEPSWKKVSSVLLDGFRYDRFLGARCPTGAAFRIAWLLKQSSPDHGVRFWPSPWEHLVKVLREMGHFEDAKRVAIEKQRQMRRARVVGNRNANPELTGLRSVLNRAKVATVNSLARALHVAYGGLAGYGYRPLRTVGWMFAAWALAGLIYSAAEAEGLFGPSNPLIYASSEFRHCGYEGGGSKEAWTRCEALPPEHIAFNPMIYSLDVILPLVDLHQETDWTPIVHSSDGRSLVAGHAVRYLMWLEILFGWIGSLLLVSVVGRLIERD